MNSLKFWKDCLAFFLYECVTTREDWTPDFSQKRSSGNPKAHNMSFLTIWNHHSKDGAHFSARQTLSLLVFTLNYLSVPSGGTCQPTDVVGPLSVVPSVALCFWVDFTSFHRCHSQLSSLFWAMFGSQLLATMNECTLQFDCRTLRWKGRRRRVEKGTTKSPGRTDLAPT